MFFVLRNYKFFLDFANFILDKLIFFSRYSFFFRNFAKQKRSNKLNKMKKTFLFLALAVVFTATTSCSKEKTENVYYFADFLEFYGISGEGPAMNKFIRDYLEISHKHEFLKVGKGKNVKEARADADRQAKMYSSQWILLLEANVGKIGEIMQEFSTFRWAVYRRANPEKPHCVEIEIVNDFKWPVQ